ncbi:hypothetical protein PSU4_13840 [Pseudonocardia sulfidoxydans NBRC 16205]|uniref:Uncharacterized protein n=1 Tax=Pseudonocardia sulfidoxydans NBRC 16205 TaxID=1223511 RepID=A0A511DCA2_9PSEU|nr:hypothetical protein PSU4_13840 [Pseudonocardia sulfidoxydans NBRC 16205]
MHVGFHLDEAILDERVGYGVHGSSLPTSVGAAARGDPVTGSARVAGERPGAAVVAAEPGRSPRSPSLTLGRRYAQALCRWFAR